jgi:glucokinase
MGVPFLLEVVDIADRARNGDQFARQIFDEMAQALAEGIRPILMEKEITCLVVGGQISKSFDIFGSTLRIALGNLPLLSQIVPAQHFSNAALLGILKKLRTLSIKIEMQ